MQSETLYEKTANQLMGQIESGVFGVGDKLPSVRALSRQMRISISTAQDALRLLERRDVVRAKPKSGYFVTRTPGTAVQIPRTMDESCGTPELVDQWRKAHHSSRSGPDLLNFGRATPDVAQPGLKSLVAGLAAITRRNSIRGLEYGELRGASELRVQLARRAREAGMELAHDDFIVTNGCQEALQCCVRAVTKPGDIVAVESPTYYGSLQALEACGLKALEIPTSPDSGMSLGALKLALEEWKVSAIMVTPNFGNPLGGVMPDKRKKQLAELAASKEIPIIEDDIFADLADSATRHLSIKSFDDQGWVMLCSSFSKSIAPGIRIGWCAPGRFFENVEHQKYVASMPTATLTQLAIAEFMSKGNYERHLRQVTAKYRKQRDQMIDLIGRYFPTGTRVTRPDGGLLIWVEMPEEVDSLKLSKLALSNKIGIAPGPMFSASQRYGNFIRINCCHEVDKEITEAVRTLGALAHGLLVSK